LKVIIYNKHDFFFAEEQAESKSNAILFSLNGAKKKKMTKCDEINPRIISCTIDPLYQNLKQQMVFEVLI
jgi:hypothetical protein